jgi:hypothetical protein
MSACLSSRTAVVVGLTILLFFVISETHILLLHSITAGVFVITTGFLPRITGFQDSGGKANGGFTIDSPPAMPPLGRISGLVPYFFSILDFRIDSMSHFIISALVFFQKAFIAISFAVSDDSNFFHSVNHRLVGIHQESDIQSVIDTALFHTCHCSFFCNASVSILYA